MADYIYRRPSSEVILQCSTPHGLMHFASKTCKNKTKQNGTEQVRANKAKQVRREGKERELTLTISTTSGIMASVNIFCPAGVG
jgi:hypothetical protein